MENQSRLEKIREALEVESVVVGEVIQPEIFNHRKATIVRPHTFIVVPNRASESLHTFYEKLLSSQEGIYRPDKGLVEMKEGVEYGRIYSFQSEGEGVTRKIEIEMFPSVEIALQRLEGYKERL